MLPLASMGAGLRLQISSPPGLPLGKCGSQGGGGSIYKSGWIDLNKNGKLDPYEDSSRPVPERVEDLLSQMTPQEKFAQLGSARDYIASQERNALQRGAIEHSRLGIPLAFGCAPGSGGWDSPEGGKAGLRLSKGLRAGSLDDSVRRLLRAKFLRGLFDQPYVEL